MSQPRACGAHLSCVGPRGPRGPPPRPVPQQSDEAHTSFGRGIPMQSRFYLFLLALLAAPSSALAACTAQIVGNDFIISGCNVHIRNGTGSTTTINGLGNLIIGYNENSNPVQPRGGSHNLVVGKEHGYTNVAGVVSGEHNKID